MANAHLSAVFDNHKRMQVCAQKLNRLGDCFANTGNDKVAMQLFDIADDIMDSANEVRDTHGQELDRQWKQTRENTGNILSALVAGVELSKSSSSQA